jgi:hypothetical protein
MPIQTDSEKEDYYRYGPDPRKYTYKEPDVLPYEVSALMTREGLNDRWRFVWMGAAVVRVHGNTLDRHPVIKGDPRACVYRPMEVVLDGLRQMGLWLQPKDLCVRTPLPGYWYWIDDEGIRHIAEREDQLVAPEGRLAHRQDMMWDFGHLVWTLQMKIAGEVGVKERLWSPADAPNEYWQTMKTFRNSRNNGYLQPTVRDVEYMILKREYEDRHLSNQQMRELIVKEGRERERHALEASAKQEAADNAEWHERVEQVVAENARQTAYGGAAKRRS